MDVQPKELPKKSFFELDFKNQLLKLKQLIRTRPFVLGVAVFFTLAMFVYIVFVPANIKKRTQTFVAAVQNQGLTQTMQEPAPTVTAIPSPIFSDVSETTPKPSPTPTFIVTPTLDPSINWVYYINSQYGYSIRYPSNWMVRDLGVLEPKIPSYITFDQNTASASSRSITISESTRTYQEQLTIGGQGSPVIIAGIKGVQQFFQDSNGFQSIAIVLPRNNDILILRTKTGYVGVFNQMLSTLKVN